MGTGGLKERACAIASEGSIWTLADEPCGCWPCAYPLPPPIQPPLLTSFVFPRHLPPSHRALPSSTTATTAKTSFRRHSQSICPLSRHLIDAKLVDDRPPPTGRPPSLPLVRVRPSYQASLFFSFSHLSPRPQLVACISLPNFAQLISNPLSSLDNIPHRLLYPGDQSSHPSAFGPPASPVCRIRVCVCVVNLSST